MFSITPVKQATFAPVLHLLIERAPLKTNDVVIERLPSGLRRMARVMVCYFDDSMGANGEWTCKLKFYQLVQLDSGEWVQDMNSIMYTETNPKVCEKVGE